MKIITIVNTETYLDGKREMVCFNNGSFIMPLNILRKFGYRSPDELMHRTVKIEFYNKGELTPALKPVLNDNKVVSSITILPDEHALYPKSFVIKIMETYATYAILEDAREFFESHTQPYKDEIQTIL